MYIDILNIVENKEHRMLNLIINRWYIWYLKKKKLYIYIYIVMLKKIFCINKK